MTKHRRPLINVNNREQQFAKLLTAMGLNEMGPLGEYALKAALEQIALDYQRSVADPSKLLVPKRVRQLRAAIAKVLALHKAAGSDTLDNEIELASLQLLNPNADASTLRMLIADHRPKHRMAVELSDYMLNIDHWLASNQKGYKKRQVRKLVVEPFLKLMAEYEITTSRRERPRKQIFDALFDWLGVEQNIRASNANINTIAAELAGAGPKKSKANRRPKT
ncbi:UNVERIFIED_ORG: hypothetical protein M2193_002203 [Bradyrhizobium japonicum]|jgi:hypothetical protein|uniref:Uncharacterized protein n=1 Tax=Bradyrhizobium diazoefficiens TaxID=1355477 RepID=A0A809ZHY1_9BRAD|nr:MULTISPECIES: hypothetical protein [Bradyrhizobium]MDA9389309.1 hypothetical protein [Bradyrhizobium sp. CCBAU 45394]WLA76483.1 hypothetical protein QIH77_15265 [Bradyrhizobium diazoefficiens]BCE24194.1 hypothetical protein XF1B_68750 [Bradyrhizobium diazoefficiens]BCE50450.1 hypothetical protein XF4B_67990 [Bradyrhizobium diazoefficiens]BCE93954.1 hypothetical protein XF10B_67520 [Bradyrhizobium diazoefficiens]